MTTPPNVSEFPVDSQQGPTPALSPTRPLYWSIRRELWENRSLYIAPLAVSALVLFAFLFSAMTLPRRMRTMLALSEAKQHEMITMPYNAVAGTLVMTAFLVGVFYCLDALHGERRDRSILFWKSLPVSDRTIVLSKAAIPLVVLPLLIFALAVTTQLSMFLANNLVLLRNGAALEALWTHVKFVQTTLAFFYGLVAIALWHAPVYTWLLLVSAWARRATLLWAVLPVLGIGAFEKVAFNSTHFMKLVGYRLVGWFPQAFDVAPKGARHSIDPLADLNPGKFLSTPGLWIGLAFAALFLAATVRLRRNREPI